MLPFNQLFTINSFSPWMMLSRVQRHKSFFQSTPKTLVAFILSRTPPISTLLVARRKYASTKEEEPKQKPRMVEKKDKGKAGASIAEKAGPERSYLEEILEEKKQEAKTTGQKG
jgi:hypothetical protein